MSGNSSDFNFNIDDINTDFIKNRSILIVVENLPVPFDRRVWLEARTLHAAGAKVSVICPKGKGYDSDFEQIGGIDIYRHSLPQEAKGALGYIAEYCSALFHESRLAWKVYFRNGIDVIQGCNPPDLIFLVAVQFRLLGVKFLFDHHDINPELYEAKFDKRGFFWNLLVLAEKLTFKASTVSIATNESYKSIAMERGRMKPEDVFVVRSGPDLSKVRRGDEVATWKNGRQFLVGYVGVMGHQEGIDLLLESIHHLVSEMHREDIQFVLVGDGPAYDDLKRMANELGVEDYVTFTGRASDKDLFEILSTADVCVNPDRVNPMNDKSTMNKVMEYMALSKPIVQFDVREGRFSAQDASLYAKANDPIDFADKVVELLSDPDRRRKMGSFGYERVKSQLSWNQSIDPLLSAYRRALRAV